MQPNEQAALPGTLYIVATPIGNLRDITLRALDVLKTADVVAAEDTRVSQGLLAAYGIRTRMFALHEHNERAASEKLIAMLQDGRSVALISDAGTPAISDPGALLVQAARAAGVAVIPIPGPSAVATALSAAGMSAPHWLFYGFLPHKASGRRQALETLRDQPWPIVFYESPHRILECVADLANVLGAQRRMTIARELTKRFEQVWTLPLSEAASWLEADSDRMRGEFVLLVEGAAPGTKADETGARRVLAILLEEMPASQAAKLAARLTGCKRSLLYAWSLQGNAAAAPDAAEDRD